MFLKEIKLSEQSTKVIQKIEKRLGVVPEHLKLFASVNEPKFNLYIQELAYYQSLKKLHKDYFTFIRLYVANKENFLYCKNLNTTLLQNANYSMEQIDSCKDDIYNIALNNEHKILAKLSIKAIYNPDAFNSDDLKILNDLGWNDEYIYASIDHSALLFKQSRILKAYLK